jgi:hypothetical protein
MPGRPLIVEQAGARPHHLSVVAAQLAAPFRPLTPTAESEAASDGSGEALTGRSR